jgi:hypothetical protein
MFSYSIIVKPEDLLSMSLFTELNCKVSDTSLQYKQTVVIIFVALFPCRNMGDKVKKIKKENPDRQAIKRHIWKSSEDKILLNILKDQTLNGGKEGTSYTKKAWREIQEQFNDSKVDKLELQQIKNRHKCYRSCFFLNEAKDLPFSLIEQKYRC